MCRTGFITEQSLREVCRDLGTPISEKEISHLMAESVLIYTTFSAIYMLCCMDNLNLQV